MGTNQSEKTSQISLFADQKAYAKWISAQDSGMGTPSVSNAGDEKKGADGNIQWELKEDGILILSGTGSISDYSFQYENGRFKTSAPWGTDVSTVVILSGIKCVGESCFCGCGKLIAITIPESVISIGNYAFCDCPALSDVLYLGNREQWDSIQIGRGNDSLTGAAIRFSTTANQSSAYINKNV